MSFFRSQQAESSEPWHGFDCCPSLLELVFKDWVPFSCNCAIVHRYIPSFDDCAAFYHNMIFPSRVKYAFFFSFIISECACRVVHKQKMNVRMFLNQFNQKM